MDWGSVGTGIVVLLLIAGMYYFSRRYGPTLSCTRCSGTGEINERWPDPNGVDGWHILEGKCPKCKGRGRVSMTSGKR